MIYQAPAKPEPNPYEAEARRIRDRIRDLHLLRDAQARGSELEARFQDEITELTEALIRWEQAAPMLEQLDIMVAGAERDVRAAGFEFDYAGDGWMRLASAGAGLGALLLAIAVIWSPPWWVPAAGVVALLGAGAAVLRGLRERRDAEDHLDRAERLVETIRDERATLTPVPASVTAVAEIPTARAGSAEALFGFGQTSNQDGDIEEAVIVEDHAHGHAGR